MIPKIIHQVWINEDNREMPKDWEKSPIEWKKHHPEWEYMLWEKENSRNFIKDNYPEYLEFYDNLEYTIQRCDMIRYFFLYHYGGIYSDLDNYPLENLEKYFDPNVDTYFAESAVLKGKSSNNIIVTKKEAPIFLEIHNKLRRKVPFYIMGKHLKVMYITGPELITSIINTKKFNVKLLPSERFNPYKCNDNFKIKKDNISIMTTKGGSWIADDTKFYLFMFGNYIGIIILVLLIIFIILYIYFEVKNIKKISS